MGGKRDTHTSVRVCVSCVRACRASADRVRLPSRFLSFRFLFRLSSLRSTMALLRLAPPARVVTAAIRAPPSTTLVRVRPSLLRLVWTCRRVPSQSIA